MTFLLWLLITALAAGIVPAFIARQLTKGRGQLVDISGKAVTWGVGAFLLAYLAISVPWLVVSWSGLIGAPWLITGLVLGTPAAAWASKKWYRTFKGESLSGSGNKYFP